MSTVDKLRYIAAILLNDEGLSVFERFVEDEKLDSAKHYLLGVIDRCVDDNVIEATLANEFYSVLDVPEAIKLELRARLHSGGVS